MRRRLVQIASALALNPLLPNFLRGRIYTGGLKHVCVPALNCYSCPAAVGACPLGSAQVTLNGLRGSETGALGASVYVLSAIMLVGALAGRFACGWICPFGALQELIHLRKRPGSLPRAVPWIRYSLLVGLILAVPLLSSFPASPAFCKWVCPAGTLEAGAPIVGYDAATGRLGLSVGLLFAWKVALAVIFLGGALLVSRFFCRVACPLGAAWGLFNRFSLVTVSVDMDSCTRCGACRGSCPVDLLAYEGLDSAACVRCMNCVSCPSGAVRVRLRGFGREVAVRRETVAETVMLESEDPGTIGGDKKR